MKRLDSILWIGLLFLSVRAMSQTGVRQQTARVIGTVVAAETGEAIVGANVQLTGTVLGAATTQDGSFTVPVVPVGTYTLRVTAMGFKKEERTITVIPGRELTIAFQLHETVLSLDGVAVTASRYRQSVNDIPVSLSLVPSSDLKERNITSVDQALRYVPGVNSGGGGQIAIRGSSGFNWGVGSRVLVLLNGQPFLTGDIRNVNWYALPTSNIQQIEVMKGSGSVLYGSSAMGGVVNIITDDPDDGHHIHVRSHTGFYNRPSHRQWQWTDKRHHFEGTAVDLSSRIGPVSAMFSTNFQYNTGYKENDDHNIFSLMATLACRLHPNMRFDLMTGHSRNDGGFFIYWKSLSQPFENGSDPFGFRTRSQQQNTFVYPSLSWVISPRLFVAVKGRFNRAFSEDHLEDKTGFGRVAAEAFRSSTARTRGGEIQLNAQISSKTMLVAGCDLQTDAVESIQFGQRQINQSAYYLQVEQQIWRGLKVTAGARYDGEQGPEIGSSGELSRKFGLNMTPWKGTQFRFSLGEGFRTPAIGERFVTTYTGGLQIVPNPNLLPERSQSIEVGFKQTLGNAADLDLALFDSRYENLIEPQLDTGTDHSVVVRFQNVVRARIRGVDVSTGTEWFSRMVSIRAGYTYLDTKDLTPGQEYGAPLKYRSRHTFYLSGDLRLLPAIMGFDFRYLSAIQRVDTYHKAFIKDIDQVAPTYVVSLRFGVSGEHLGIRFLVDNLFQYNYLESPANMGPPRTVTVQVTVNY